MNNDRKLKIEKKYLFVHLLFILSIIVLWMIGNLFNVNIIILSIYILYLFILYKIRPFNIIPYSWMFIMSSLNIVGVFICENSNIFLIEMEMSSAYYNSLAPIVLCYILLFGFMFYKDESILKEDNKNIISNNSSKSNRFFLKTLCILSIIVVALCLLRAISHPYFNLGVTRDIYYTNYLSRFEQILKGHYFMLIPIFVIYSKKYNRKIYYILFIILMSLWLILIGEKFGSLFFLFYLVLMFSSIHITKRDIKKYLICLSTIICVLLGVIYFQRTVLSNSKDNIIETYFYQRIAQSGQVWWGTYHRIKNINILELNDEIRGILYAKNDEFYGQWKMMITCTSASSARYRALIRSPFASTTTASIYYYFGIIGLIIFYPLMGLLYRKVIFELLYDIKNNKLLEIIILLRILFFIHNMYFASDFSLFNPKGLVYIFAYFIIKKLNYKKTSHDLV